MAQKNVWAFHLYIHMFFYKIVREWILTQWVSVGTGFWEANKMGKKWAYSACQAGEVKVRLSMQGCTAAHESRQSQLRDMILYLWYQWQDTVSIAFTSSRTTSRTLRIHLHLSFASTRVDCNVSSITWKAPPESLLCNTNVTQKHR